MKKKFIILWVIFFIILFLSPISGDDWTNYVIGKQGPFNMIKNTIGMYFFWEGRLVSRAFINLLTYNKWLWNIINSLLISIMIIHIVKIIKPKDNKTIILLCLLGILCMNIYMFSQTITWVAGNITYLFPLVLLILYLYFLKTDQVKKYPVIFGILNFILPMFVEHMAVLLILLNIIVIVINYIKNRKIDKLMVIYLCISIFSTLFMFLSPGTKKRINMENTDFNKLSIIGKMITNIPNFIYYTFIINGYLNILWIIAIVYLNHHTTKNNILKWIIDIFVISIPLYLIFHYHINMIKTPSFDPVSYYYHWYIILYYIIFTLLFIYFIIKNIRKKDYFYILILVLLGFSSNMIMMISPTWGYRTALTTYILLLIALIWIISKIKLPNIISKIISLSTVVVVIIYFVLYINLYQINQERKQIIKEDMSKETIRVKKLPSYAPCNSDPYNEYHDKAFKSFYQIDPNKKIIMID